MAQRKGAKPQGEEVTMANTKKEMLEAYQELLGRLQAKRQAELKPEQRVKEREEKTAVEASDSLSLDGIGQEIGTLKSEIGRMLGQLSDRLEDEIEKYQRVKRAVEVRERELKEIYEIERAASTLTALLDAQKERREQFDAEMAEQKEELEGEIEATREEWEEETEAYKAEVKERDAAEKKRRDREAADYKYQFGREKQLAREEFEYEKAKLERETEFKREEMAKDLAAREKALAESEGELNGLRERAAAFPPELEAAVGKAVGEATERLGPEAETRQELLNKDFEGERNVLSSRIESLQRTVQEQADHVARLSAQIEKSYGQVQDIAVKAIEGSASVKALASMQARLADQARRPAQGEA